MLEGSRIERGRKNRTNIRKNVIKEPATVAHTIRRRILFIGGSDVVSTTAAGAAGLATGAAGARGARLSKSRPPSTQFQIARCCEIPVGTLRLHLQRETKQLRPEQGFLCVE